MVRSTCLDSYISLQFCFFSPDEPKLNVLTQHWKEGQLTNWEYLMALNQISGRTFQDLMQYPVFPWILAQYESCSLNLLDPAAFRDLGKPIAIQHKDSQTHYINNYNVRRRMIVNRLSVQ